MQKNISELPVRSQKVTVPGQVVSVGRNVEPPPKPKPSVGQLFTKAAPHNSNVVPPPKPRK